MLLIVARLYVLVDAAKVAKQANPYQLKWYNRWYVYAGIILISDASVPPAIRTFVVQAYRIPSGAMIPTLQIEDRILVNKLAYGIRNPLSDRYLVRFKEPRRGDVIVFVYPEDRAKDFVKRVIAVAGDTVEIRRKKLFINGTQIEDPHAHFVEATPTQAPIPVRDDFDRRTCRSVTSLSWETIATTVMTADSGVS